VSIAEARKQDVFVRLVVEGQVTVPPGVFGRRIIYIQDSTAGIMVYLSRGRYPRLSEGDWVRVRGQVWDFHGEKEILVGHWRDVERLGGGEPLEPVQIKTGEVNEENEGLLVEITGEVVGYAWNTIYLDDGSGKAKVYIKRATGVKKPWVEKGEIYRVVGVVSQYAEAPYEGGYRLLPRYQSDISLAVPVLLPVTGGESPLPDDSAVLD
jgi:DNA/RNA endonuclease YhcR with UshA esterase domain